MIVEDIEDHLKEKAATYSYELRKKWVEQRLDRQTTPLSILDQYLNPGDPLRILAMKKYAHKDPNAILDEEGCPHEVRVCEVCGLFVPDDDPGVMYLNADGDPVFRCTEHENGIEAWSRGYDDPRDEEHGI